MPYISMYCRLCNTRQERHHNARKCVHCGGTLTHVPWDQLYCELHNLSNDLLGNTQASDINWLAHTLWQSSRLGAGDIRSVPWLIGRDQWDYLGLTPEAIIGDGPRRWDMLTAEQQEAWKKLARIVLYVMPAFAERVGHRFMDQAKAFRAAWKIQRDNRTAEAAGGE